MAKREEFLSKQEEMYRTELEKISGLSAQEAKDLIIKNLENEAKHDAQAMINKIEQEAQITAEKKAKDVLITTIQRLAPEVTSDITVTTVSLPDMIEAPVNEGQKVGEVVFSFNDEPLGTVNLIVNNAVKRLNFGNMLASVVERWFCLLR